FPINEKLIKERTKRSKREYLEYLIRFIPKNFTLKNILQGLGEVLDARQKVWVKRYLISEVIKKIREKI
ncbi:hypothetical protein J7J18_06115, partial [bacterium]|nr:hypothetical protein [bacterium]